MSSSIILQSLDRLLQQNPDIQASYECMVAVRDLQLVIHELIDQLQITLSDLQINFLQNLNPKLPLCRAGFFGICAEKICPYCDFMKDYVDAKSETWKTWCYMRCQPQCHPRQIIDELNNSTLIYQKARQLELENKARVQKAVHFQAQPQPRHQPRRQIEPVVDINQSIVERDSEIEHLTKLLAKREADKKNQALKAKQLAKIAELERQLREYDEEPVIIEQPPTLRPILKAPQQTVRPAPRVPVPSTKPFVNRPLTFERTDGAVNTPRIPRATAAPPMVPYQQSLFEQELLAHESSAPVVSSRQTDKNPQPLYQVSRQCETVEQKLRLLLAQPLARPQQPQRKRKNNKHQRNNPVVETKVEVETKKETPEADFEIAEFDEQAQQADQTEQPIVHQATVVKRVEDLDWAAISDDDCDTCGDAICSCPE